MALLIPKTGEADVATAGTAVQLSSSETHYREVVFTAKSGNTADIVLGDSNVVGAAGATRRGIELSKGTSFTLTAPGSDDPKKPPGMTQWIDLSKWYVDCESGNTDGVAWVAIN